MPTPFGVNLQASVSVSNKRNEVKAYGDPQAEHNDHNGIERNGGVGSIYQKQTTYSEVGYKKITESARVLSASDIPGTDLKNISVDGMSIGQVSKYGVESRTKISGFDDIGLTADGTYIAIKIRQNVVTISEYSLSNVLLNSRTVTFTNLTSAFYPFFTSLSLIKYDQMHYVDSQEFLLRIGDQGIVLKESTPNQGIILSGGNTTALGANTINAAIVYKGLLVIAGNGGRVASFDGSNWRNYDGTGTGQGISNNGTVIGTNNILCMAVYQTTTPGVSYLVFAGVGGRLGSFDGNSFIVYTTASPALANNATAIGTDDILGMVQYNNALVICGGVAATSGRVANWVPITGWTNYNAVNTGVSVLANNSTVLGASNQIRSVALYNGQLIFGGQNGRLGSVQFTTNLGSRLTLPSALATDALVGLNSSGIGIAMSDSGTTGVFWRTTNNGISWSSRANLPSNFTNNKAIQTVAADGNRFIGLSGNTGTCSITRSTNGGQTWLAIQTFAFFGKDIAMWTSGATDYVIIVGDDKYIISTDGGVTFGGIQTIPGPGAFIQLRSVTWSGGSNLVVVGQSATGIGAVWTSSNNGTSFSASSTITGWGATAATKVRRSLSTGTLIVVGGNGAWSRSTNNGSTWTTLSTVTSWVAASVSVGGHDSTWIMVGGAGNFSQSTDDGVTWASMTTPSGTGNFTSLAYNSSAFIAGGNAGSYALNNFNTVVWINFDGSGTGFASMPRSNGTIIGTNQINALLVYTPTNILAVAGVGGRIGSINGTTITAYTAGTGLSNNATVVGSEDILSMVQFGTTLVFGSGTTGRLGSWDGTNFKNYDGTGTGTGVSNNGTLVGANPIRALAVYNSKLWAFALNLSNSMTLTGQFVPFYLDGSTAIANLLTGAGNAYIYAFRYDPEGAYLIIPMASQVNTGYVMRPDLVTVSTLKGRFAVKQTSGARTRHVITETPRIVGGDLLVISTVGYNDFNVFSYTQAYPVTGLTTVNAILSSIIGYAYADVRYRTSASATDINEFYAPVPSASPLSFYTIYQANTDTAVNGYGKFTNLYQVASVKPFEFRVIATNGEQSAISVAMIDGVANDALGVLVTSFGELDPGYTPQIQDDDKILYQFNGNFYIIKIGVNITDFFSKVTSNLYKLNTIHPSNIYADDDKMLSVGSMDYHGQMFLTSSALPSTTGTQAAARIDGPWSNSIDTGAKQTSINPIGAGNIQVFGYRLPSQYGTFGNFEVDVYTSIQPSPAEYSFSVQNDGSESVDNNKVDTIYVETDILPTAIGGTYYGTVAVINGSTIVLAPDYDGYLTDNVINREFLSFLLFGQTYLFDGEWVYLATINANVLTSYDRVAPADGLIFIASSPNAIYFLSNFDNSIYTFNGGRTLDKFKRFTNSPDILSGQYSVHDNTLLLDSTTKLIWIRDSVITENEKLVTQTALDLVETVQGLMINNDLYQWQYTYEAISGSTVVPFLIKTAYFGVAPNELSILSAVIFTIYDPLKAARTVKLTHDAYDQDQSYQETVFFDFVASDYDPGGYARKRFQPENQTNIGNAIQLECDNYIFVNDLSGLFEDAGVAPIAAQNSR